VTAPGPAPGPLAEEARRLVEAARDWAVRTFPDVDGHLATGGAQCRWCPLCRAVAGLRADRPEVTAKLAEVVTAAAGALAAVLDAARPTAGPDADPAGSAGSAGSGSSGGLGGAGPPAAASTPPGRVEPIPLDED